MMTHILLVEDDLDDQMFFSTSLQEVAPGTLLSLASTGEEAIAFLDGQSAPPDICVFDINVPGATGIDVLRKIKAEPRYNRTYVVMLTTSSDRTTREKCMSLGADAFFIKPSTHAALTDILRRIIFHS